MTTPAPPPPTVQSSGPAPSGAPAAAPGSLTVPAGGHLVAVQGDMPDGSATVMVVFDIGNGTLVYYDTSEPGQLASLSLSGMGSPQMMSKQQFYGQRGLLQGGNIAAITSDKWDPTGHTAPQPGQSFQDWMNQQINIYAGGQDWVKDQDMLHIYEQWITNPQLSPDQIQAEIRKTNWWATHSAQNANFATLSPTDQAQAVQSEALKLQQSYLQTTGKLVQLNDPYLVEAAQAVASGTMSEAAVVGDYQTIAIQDPHSPLSRSLLGEQQAERQRSADIATNMGQLNSLSLQYGFQPNPDTIKQQAADIVDNKTTIADLTQTLKDQALSKFPGYNPNMTVEQWAQPWSDSYSRLLEQSPTGGIFDPTIQKAMTENTPLWQFNQTLRSDPRWMDTENGKSTIMSAVGGVAAKMGFE